MFILWKQFFCLNDRKKASQKEDVNKTHGDDYYSFVWIPILLFALLFYDAVYFALFFLIVNIIVEKKVLSKLYTDVKWEIWIRKPWKIDHPQNIFYKLES